MHVDDRDEYTTPVTEWSLFAAFRFRDILDVNTMYIIILYLLSVLYVGDRNEYVIIKKNYFTVAYS